MKEPEAEYLVPFLRLWGETGNNILNSLMRCDDVNKPPSVSSEMTDHQNFVFHFLYSQIQSLTFYLISAVFRGGSNILKT